MRYPSGPQGEEERYQCLHTHGHSPAKMEPGEAQVGAQTGQDAEGISRTDERSEHPSGVLGGHLGDVDWHHHVDYTEHVKHNSRSKQRIEKCITLSQMFPGML